MNAIPSLPRLLGYTALLPQLVCLAIVLWGPVEWHRQALTIGTAYAALVLAFLGGSWWGIAAAAPAAERRQALGWLWIAAVVPFLLALGAGMPILLGDPRLQPALAMLGAAQLLSPLVDARLGPLAPRWWLALRVPLSLGLGAATLAMAFV